MSTRIFITIALAGFVSCAVLLGFQSTSADAAVGIRARPVLQPLLHPVAGRNPHDAWIEHKRVGSAKAFVTLLAQHRGWTYERTWDVLENQHYQVRPIVGWWYSDGYNPRLGAYGTIHRQGHPGELGAFFDGPEDTTPDFSGECGNGGKDKPQKKEMVCRELPTVVSSDFVGGGGAWIGPLGAEGDTVETLGVFHPFECEMPQ